MTVFELIEQLKNYDPATSVYVADDSGQFLRPPFTRLVTACNVHENSFGCFPCSEARPDATQVLEIVAG